VEELLGDESTESERGQAFVKLALNKRAISLLSTLLDRSDLISYALRLLHALHLFLRDLSRAWYQKEAFLMNADLVAQVTHLLVNIEAISFDLLIGKKPSIDTELGNDSEFSVVYKKKKVVKKKKKKSEVPAVCSCTVEETLRISQDTCFISSRRKRFNLRMLWIRGLLWMRLRLFHLIRRLFPFPNPRRFRTLRMVS